MRVSHVVALVCVSLWGCGIDLAPPEGSSAEAPALIVRVSSGTLTLPTGQSVRLTATVTDPKGVPVSGVDSLEWSISDSTVASLKGEVLTTLKPGSTTVSVLAHVSRMGASAKGQAVITVNDSPNQRGSCGDGTCSLSEACECMADCGACTGGPTSMFANVTPTDATAGPVGPAAVMGSKFKVARAGRVTTLKFFKGAGDTSTHRGALWTSNGQKLAEATFSDETLSGWQTVTLSSPVTLMPGTTYVVSLHSSRGQFVSIGGFFDTATTQGPLRALANGEDGPNGLFQRSANSVFPTGSIGPYNYFVDVVFEQE
jgi:hypothetical protein